MVFKKTKILSTLISNHYPFIFLFYRVFSWILSWNSFEIRYFIWYKKNHILFAYFLLTARIFSNTIQSKEGKSASFFDTNFYTK